MIRNNWLKEKDALTDLVDEAGAETSDAGTVLQEGEAVTPSGEVVTLGAEDDAKLDKIARGLLKMAKEGKLDKYK